MDGSAASDRAVNTAAGTAKAFGAHVSVVCLVDPFPVDGVGADMAFALNDCLDAAPVEANLALKRASQHGDTSGAALTTSVVEGRAVDAAIPDAPWWVVQADDKKKARLNCIHHHTQMPYGETEHPPMVLPERVRHDDDVRSPVAPDIGVPEIY